MRKILKISAIVIFIIIILLIVVAGSSDNKNKSKEVSTNDSSTISSSNDTKITPTKAKTETKKEYISKCKTYKFKEIARNPNKYKGKRVKFTGEVIQVQEDFFNEITLRVNVTKDEYGYWDDTILVYYTYESEDSDKILEDDIITLYGECQGQTSYTSVLGSQVSLPQVDAKYIDIK